MTVVESYFAGTKYDVTPPPSDLPENLVDILKLGIAINSSYTSKLIVVSHSNLTIDFVTANPSSTCIHMYHVHAHTHTHTHTTPG